MNHDRKGKLSFAFFYHRGTRSMAFQFSQINLWSSWTISESYYFQEIEQFIWKWLRQLCVCVCAHARACMCVCVWVGKWVGDAARVRHNLATKPPLPPLKRVPSTSHCKNGIEYIFSSVQLHSRVWLWNLMDCARQASLSITNSWSLHKLMSIELVILSNHPILCCPLLLPPSIFPSIRVFSKTSQRIYISAIIFRKFNPPPWAFGFDVILFLFNKLPVADLSQGQILLLITKGSQSNTVRICFINPWAIKCHFNVGYLINITI